jgi:hypothetical protein
MGYFEPQSHYKTTQKTKETYNEAATPRIFMDKENRGIVGVASPA